MEISRQNPIPWTYFSSHRHSVPSLFMFHMWYSFLYTLLLYSFLWKLTISYPGIVCRYIREYLVNILLIDCLANIVFMTVKILTALTARSYIIFIHKLMFFFFWGHCPELQRNGSMSPLRNSAQILLKLCKRRLFIGCWCWNC